MHAFLITSRTNKAADRKIKDFLDNFDAKPYPFELKKIDDVRALGRFTRLSLNQKTAVIIKEFDKASEPAQNAFLKSLEEPQENLIYILTASSENSVLPTILSRCQLININNQPKISREEIKKAKKFFSQSTIKKLETISRIKGREEAVEFTTSLILGGYKLMKKTPNLAFPLEKAQKTLTALQKNGNPTLQLINLCLQTNTF